MRHNEGIIRNRDQRPARKRVFSPAVAETRAEILGMITQLTATRRTIAFPSRPARKPAATTPSGASASRDHASDGSLAKVMTALQGLESRLSRIEDGLVQGAKASAPAKAPPEDATFSGAIQGQMLSDMLQLVSSNAMSGIFVIENDTSRCTLYFEEGRMCHAESPGVTGEEAFFSAFATESGKYHFKEMTKLPPERTVSAGTQFLVLEALRRMDEGRAK
jgi:hypothetical protein